MTAYKDMTADERKEYHRQATRRKRERDRAAQADTRNEFWAQNRALLAPQELTAMQAQHERCLDLIHWMEHIDELTPDDELFVDHDEGTAELVEFVKEHGATHNSYVTKDQTIPPDWSTRLYWRDSKLLEKLEAEGWQTAQYVRYGFFAALPDWIVAEFLIDRAGWSNEAVNKLLGRVLAKDPDRGTDILVYR